ncbi:tannase/feruloyl esterase family alpha/beta hydrolase [Zoogloea dura]|uniref:Tannase/feruloyl esterase family alpha/beta hydrolase n=1 Tax=Zoogloea dura TaxID=2728840 RepID=A0A848G985_9RHOO|nr:tannase/feruloyl esterase family alpha/beta hydrolase [Zoogloea dura]NML27465.1 tannase/feruloyl esterase family alpha/beta hydrolase [Zoogloea dura]
MQKSLSRVSLAIPFISASLLSACGGGGGSSSAPAIVSAAQACANLSGKKIGAAVVSSATIVEANNSIPRYCRVSATIAPTLDVELEIPDNWNGKMLYIGGGGYDGAINDPAVWQSVLSPGNISKGYVLVMSNGGHRGSAVDASFAADPSLAALFGSGSVPTTAQTAKEMISVAMGKGPERSYFEGCSNGGREGLMAVQRDPLLFDGVIARAPAHNWTGQIAGAFNRNAKAVSAAGGAMPADKVALLAKAVRSSCDGADGVIDGIVSDPEGCHFDPMSLRCPNGGEGASCLSDAQLAVVSAWTQASSFGGGAYTHAGWALTGNEDDAGGWALWLTGATGDGGNSLQFLFQDTTIKNYLAVGGAANSLAYDIDSNPSALRGLAGLNDATNSNLAPFANSGAKLILWHGTSDAALSYKQTVSHYMRVKDAMGGQADADKFMRFYLAPGVNHCNGGVGADSVDLVTALDKWVSEGAGPGALVATKRNPDGSEALSRPICVYPQYPRYTGPSNDVNAATKAANYSCTTPAGS